MKIPPVLSRVFAKASPTWQKRLDARLYDAAAKGENSEATAKTMSRLIGLGASINVVCATGMPLFCYLCAVGKDILAAQLLAAGADPNTRTPDGATAFLMAANMAQPKVMMLLANAGADLQEKKPNGLNALELLIHGHPQPLREEEAPRYRDAYEILVARAGLSLDDGMKRWIFTERNDVAVLDGRLEAEVELITMTQQGKVARVRELLAAGVHPDSAAKYGVNRALYHAIIHGFMGITQALIDAGADIHGAFAADASTPLELAATNSHHQIFAMLVNAGADPEKHAIRRHQNGRATTLTLDELAEENGRSDMAPLIRQTVKERDAQMRDVSAGRAVSVGAPLKFLKARKAGP